MRRGQEPTQFVIDVDQGAGALSGQSSSNMRIVKGNVMPEASEDLTVAGLFAERDARRRRDQEAAERLQRRKEEELATFKQRLEDFHLADEMIPSQLNRDLAPKEPSFITQIRSGCGPLWTGLRTRSG